MQAVEVAELDDRTHTLVVADGLTAEGFLFLAHVLGLNLHAQTARHGHVAAVFERGGAEHGMVGNSRDMAGHGDGGIEIGGAPLHVDALQGIGIVAHPELIEIGQQPIVSTATTRSAVLDDDIRVFGADALAHLDEAFMVGDIQVALFLEILRAMVHDGGIGIPFDIGNLGEGGEQTVHHIEYKLLNLGVRQVEHHLGAATSQDGFTAGSLDNPFGVPLIEF